MEPLAPVKSAPTAFRMALLARKAITQPPRSEFNDISSDRGPQIGVAKMRMRSPKLKFKKQRSITAKRLPLQEAIKNGNSEFI